MLRHTNFKGLNSHCYTVVYCNCVECKLEIEEEQEQQEVVKHLYVSLCTPLILFCILYFVLY